MSEPAPQPSVGAAPPKTPEQSKGGTEPKGSTARKKKHRPKITKQQTGTSESSGPKKIVVRNGGTSDPNVVLSPGITAQSKYSRQTTESLLSATGANLKRVATRPLNASQEATVAQIKVFMEQANEAIKAEDLDRAHNLATKAHLLSDDLLGH